MTSHNLKIKVIHGPNLNLLGQRETDIYGKITLDEINKELDKLALDKNISIDFFQSNHEGDIVDCIQKSSDYDGFLINPAAFTHTSIAIRDALLAAHIPFVEVHLSDIKKRENFRQNSYYSDIAIKTVMGLGAESYYNGFKELVTYLTNN